MNLVSFSLKTKGPHNFARRLWTVFTRFGITEARTRRALHAVIDILRKSDHVGFCFTGCMWSGMERKGGTMIKR
jgi:hypothetical protein